MFPLCKFGTIWSKNKIFPKIFPNMVSSVGQKWNKKWKTQKAESVATSYMPNDLSCVNLIGLLHFWKVNYSVEGIQVRFNRGKVAKQWQKMSIFQFEHLEFLFMEGKVSRFGTVQQSSKGRSTFFVVVNSSSNATMSAWSCL